MKTIKKGELPFHYWWIGKQSQCSYCGEVVELEQGDERSSKMWVDTDKQSLTVPCPLCETLIWFKQK